jgi:hypothetical protein
MPEKLGFDSWQGQALVLYCTVLIQGLEFSIPPIQWLTGALPIWVKWPGLEASHSSSPNIDRENAWDYSFAPSSSSLAI